MEESVAGDPSDVWKRWCEPLFWSVRIKVEDGDKSNAFSKKVPFLGRR